MCVPVWLVFEQRLAETKLDGHVQAGALASRSWKRAFCFFVHGGIDEIGDMTEKEYSEGARVCCTLQFAEQIQTYS